MILIRSGGRWAGRLEAALVVGLLAYLGRPILIPITVALLITVLLTPAVRALERVRVPSALAAAMLVLGVLSVIAFTAHRLYDPALRWLDDAPRLIADARERLLTAESPVRQVAEAAREVDRLTRPSTDDGSSRLEVEDRPPLSARILDGAWEVLTFIGVVAVLVFFLLTTRRILFRKLLRLLPDHDRRLRASAAGSAVRRRIGRHLATVTAVNLVLGLAVGTALWLLDFPSPPLWGVMAGILNFIPYLGAMAGVSVVAVVSLTTAETVGWSSLAAPAAYAFLTGVEGMVITPALLGVRLRLNPVAVLAGLLLLGFLWGVLGLLLAVPLLVTALAIAEHHPRGRPLAVLLGR
jgi:predicted PurR-regulated permease PerM